MSIVFSNRISKHYCPRCSSFDLLKIHRNFLQKQILGAENKFECVACGEVFKKNAFEQNIPIETPTFLETSNPITVLKYSELVEGSLVADIGLNNSSFEMPSASKIYEEASPHPQHDAEPNSKATEALLSFTPEDIESSETYTSSNKFPPSHNDDDQLVDEAILIEGRRDVWPYMVASLLVLFGVAYTFILMPMKLNSKEANTDQIDMSIGKPFHAVLSQGVSKPKLGVTWDKLKIPAQAKADIPKITKVVLPASTKINIPIMAKDSGFKRENVKNPRLIPDSGTKADIALGGLTIKDKVQKTSLSKASDVYQLKNEVIPEVITTTPEKKILVSRPRASNSLVEVALPKTSVRRYLVSKSDQEARKIVASSHAKISTRTEENHQKSEQVLKFSKKAALLLGVSAKDLTVLTSKKPTKLNKTLENNSVVKKVAKKPISDTNSQLLEKVTVKLIQQDLDKLLPQ